MVVCIIAFLSSFLSVPATFNNRENCVYLLIFSYRRPLQLEACLRSIATHVRGLDGVSVIYKISEPEYQKSYQELKQLFPDVEFAQEDVGPDTDLKSLMVRFVTQARPAYIMFGVDDMVVKNDIDVRECTQFLEKTGAYGFYLRLGNQVDTCYTAHTFQGIPPLIFPCPGVCQWQFSQGTYDWNYLHTTDMTIYRKADVEPFVCSLPYKSPHEFESHWAQHAPSYADRMGLCFEQPMVVSLPINIVKNDWVYNRKTGNYSVTQFLGMFEQGLRMDIEPFAHIQNRSAHMDYEPLFIMRNAPVIPLLLSEHDQ